MMILLQIASILLFLIIIPYLTGLLPVRIMGNSCKTPGIVIIAGYILMLGVFELVAVPLVMTTVYHGFTILTISFTVVILLISLMSVILEVRDRKKGVVVESFSPKPLKSLSMEEKICWGIFIFIVAFQLYMAFTRASFDGDDAYYVVQSVTAQQSDTMYRNDPNRGVSAPLDARHALAVFPIWIAYIGRISGIHATIIAHSVLPLALIPLTYLLYFQIGKILLKDKKDMLPMFMIVMSFIQMFGNVSIYTNETFLMTRTWQGKAFAGNFMIPAIFFLFLSLFVSDKKETEKERRKSERGLWLLLACVNLTSGLSTSQGVFLCAVLTVGLAFLMMVRKRKFSILCKACLTCIPNAVYILLYLFLHL